MKITGTIINYYYNCKRQCWLFYNNIRLEDNSEDVLIGKELHKEKETKNSEIQIDNIKIDKINKNYVIEYKKSNSNLDGAKMQLLYYLYILEQKGIKKNGKLIILEKNKQTTNIDIILDEDNKHLLDETLKNIEILLNSKIPCYKESKHCKKCAYYTYCKI